MRLVLLFLFFLSQMSFLFANSPVYDIIRMDGKDWKLMAKPLRWDSIAYSRIEKLLPEENTNGPGGIRKTISDTGL